MLLSEHQCLDRTILVGELPDVLLYLVQLTDALEVDRCRAARS
jgi:hypothetical protein